MFGIFPYGLTVKNHPLLRGFDDRYFIPQSRHTAVDDDAIDACKALQVLSRSVENGINICATKDLRRIFVLCKCGVYIDVKPPVRHQEIFSFKFTQRKFFAPI